MTDLENHQFENFNEITDLHSSHQEKKTLLPRELFVGDFIAEAPGSQHGKPGAAPPDGLPHSAMPRGVRTPPAKCSHLTKWTVSLRRALSCHCQFTGSTGERPVP